LAITSGAFNAHKATCRLYCINCYGDTRLTLSLFPDIAVGSSVQAHATVTHHDGTTADATNSVAWSSSSTPVATVNTSGMVHGASAGGSTIMATLDDILTGRVCDQSPPSCNTITFEPIQPVCVGACIDSISPSQGLVGTTVPVTITGLGFGSNATVNAGTGITVTVTNASDTRINANFAISPSASGSQTVKVTGSTEGPGNTGTFFVQVPTNFNGLGMNPTSEVCLLNTAGTFRRIQYQVVDQNGSGISVAGLTPQEHFTVNGSGTPGFAAFANPPNTDTSGQFNDEPVGTCFGPPPPSSNLCVDVVQTFNIVVPGVSTPFPISTSTTRRDCVQGIKVTVSTGATFTFGVVN